MLARMTALVSLSGEREERGYHERHGTTSRWTWRGVAGRGTCGVGGAPCRCVPRCGAAASHPMLDRVPNLFNPSPSHTRALDRCFR